ncbi:MAG: alanine--tRNA ligase [Candidatus Neomarinimicrobiota bacterium]|nr:MAG: alanine--tRNA ligase [Candidatus Neomarinimicrobiota bacterium]
MNSQEIRESFIQFFTTKDHRFVRSAPVIPWDDPTLLFTNAGMNQFKPYFLGEVTPEFRRAVNSQKCIRVSGKHNDLEEVGRDTYHHTFFEMLGNWSFGDYYKAEAIQWAWELVTEIWGLDKNRLWATVYQDDDEAFELWTKVTDIDPARVLRFGAKENFWEMGETGPCGPCSEIHYFIGDDLSRQAADGVNTSPEYWELWNLVFMQNYRDTDGTLSPLPEKHVDTGAGLERIVAVLQGKQSNYDTDLFTPIISRIETLTGESYASQPTPMRVIADHVRMLTLALADGAMPSNEGRGYVLRRILRRAARFGKMLHMESPFIYQLVDEVESILGSVYPEIADRKKHVQQVIQAEEKSFNETLNRGLNHFERIVAHLSTDTISGAEAFRLYDTYGFPLDLTQLMARERNLQVDEEGFHQAMEAQKSRAKAAGKFRADTSSIEWQVVTGGSNSRFIGYDHTRAEATIRKIAHQNGHVWLVLDQTPFYAESGGQIGDQGTITAANLDLKVLDTQKVNQEIVHICDGDEPDSWAHSTRVLCQVDEKRRNDTRRNHTATHLLHKALKEVLGDHVHQAGSLVTPDYLRFDLTHFEKISSDQIQQVERLVNEQIIRNTPLDITTKSFDEAREEGAEALFGEKYGDEVRVVTVGSYSKELCGGTHVDRTGDIGLCKIIEESSLAAGIRRIVAVTGTAAFTLFQEKGDRLTRLAGLLNCREEDLENRIEQLLDKNRELEKARFQSARETISLPDLFRESRVIEGIPVLVHTFTDRNGKELKEIGDRILQQWDRGIAVLASLTGDKPQLVVVVTPALQKTGYHAGTIARQIGKTIGGGGGGKQHLATAGGKNEAGWKSFLETSHTFFTDLIKSMKE